jgi:hypothetical protein
VYIKTQGGTPMPWDRFFRVYPKYNQFEKNEVFRKMYDWLSELPRINSMTQAGKQGKPALEVVVEDFVKEFNNQNSVPLSNDFNRQMIGSAVKEIIWDYGYLQTKNYRFSKSTNGLPFKSGTFFIFNKDFETKRLQMTYEVKTLSSPRSLGEFRIEYIQELARKGQGIE